MEVYLGFVIGLAVGGFGAIALAVPYSWNRGYKYGKERRESEIMELAGKYFDCLWGKPLK